MTSEAEHNFYRGNNQDSKYESYPVNSEMQPEVFSSFSDTSVPAELKEDNDLNQSLSAQEINDVESHYKETRVDLYTLESLKELRAFHSLKRALVFGLFAYLGQEKEEIQLTPGQIRNIFILAQTVPLSQIKIQQTHKRDYISNTDGWKDITQNGVFSYDFDLYKNYMLLEQHNKDAISTDLKQRNTSLAVIGHLLNLHLQYPDREFHKIFGQASRHVNNVDGITMRTRMFKVLLEHNKQFRVSELGELTGVNPIVLLPHINELCDELHIISNERGVKYRLEEINTIPVRQGSKSDKIKNALLVLNKKSEKEGHRDAYFSLKDICDEINNENPELHFTHEDLFALKTWSNLDVEGFSKKKDTNIYLTQEQKKIIQDIITIVDGLIQPSEQFITEGITYSKDILENPDLFAILANRAKLSIENSQIDNSEEILREIFINHKDITLKKIKTLFEEICGKKVSFPAIRKYMKNFQKKSNAIVCTKDGVTNIWNLHDSFMDQIKFLKTTIKELPELKQFVETITETLTGGGIIAPEKIVKVNEKAPSYGQQKQSISFYNKKTNMEDLLKNIRSREKLPNYMQGEKENNFINNILLNPHVTAPIKMLLSMNNQYYFFINFPQILDEQTYQGRENFSVYYDKNLISNDRAFEQLYKTIQQSLDNWYAEYDYEKGILIPKEEQITSEMIFMSIAKDNRK